MKIYQATLVAVVATLACSTVFAQEAVAEAVEDSAGAQVESGVLLDGDASVDTSFLSSGDEEAQAEAAKEDVITIAAPESADADADVPTGDGACTTLKDLACSTDGFSSVCTLVTERDLPDFTAGWAPTDEAFAAADFAALPDEYKDDFLAYHFTQATDLEFKCSEKVPMTNGMSTRLLCEEGERNTPIYLKGQGNSRIDLPQFNPQAGIDICGGGTIYIIDHVLVSKDYFIDEDGRVVPNEDQRDEVVLDVNDGKDYYKELLVATTSVVTGINTCEGMNPQFPNIDCLGEDNTVDVSEQAGQNVTKGYKGDMISDIVPITDSYYKVGLCPVNVHWHAGAEHFSAGEYDCSDQTKCGPSHADDEDADYHSSADDEDHASEMEEEDASMMADNETPAVSKGSGRHSRRTEAGARVGFQCNHYDADDEKFTTPYDWQFCDKSMEVGQTYEVHWPHSTAGACGTPNQYQTPFKDGVFCNLPLDAFLTLKPQDIASNVGV